ncbi:AraC family transcriptional regulator [Falsiroseomonas ponticola]|uniref:AraC family transcriptional regulator n=1 Tax=Falsiroseomonas ponticola TaxID=2786951 RepID=UPI0019319F8A|nr:AraC family transcriptional regulator [Roseomonas ponticola]
MQPGEAGLQSLAQFYSHGGYAPFLRAMHVAGSAGVPLVRFAQPGGEFPDPPTPDYTLAINETGRGRLRFDIGLGRREQPFRRGDLVLKPPGVPTFFANHQPHAKSFISLQPALVATLAREATGRDAPDFGRLHEAAFPSAVIAGLLDMMWAEAAHQGPAARLFSDGAVIALVATLLRLARPESPPAPLPQGLAPARLARVRDWVQANLAEPFGLAEMAASAGLSAFHFSRAFKLATGQTPRAYVLARRLDHARELLADPSLPLAEVAQRCGFADQAHFTTQFRRALGVTPGVWRRGRR